MDDLFPDAVQKSPYVLFCERHNIKINPSISHPKQFVATCPSNDIGHRSVTEKDAVHGLARIEKLEGWEGVNW